MSLVTEIQAQIAALQAKLAILQSVEEDTFPIGTIALFAANAGNTKWYYRKVAEETWAKVVGTGEKPLREWVYEAKTLPMGYFEVFILQVPVTPFYASE